MFRCLVAVAFAVASQLATAALDLNTASKDDLVALSGIGPAKAQAIIDYRSQHGGFKSLDELKDVKGIGARRYQKLKPELTLAPVAAPRAAAKNPAVPTRADAKPIR